MFVRELARDEAHRAREDPAKEPARTKEESGIGWKSASTRWQELTGETIAPDALRARFKTEKLPVRTMRRSVRWTDSDLRKLAAVLERPLKR